MAEIDPARLQQEVAEAEQKSMVVIMFTGPGQAEFTMFKQNVTPAQVLGALSVLELQVKNWYIQEENQRQERMRAQQLSVPKPEILRTK